MITRLTLLIFLIFPGLLLVSQPNARAIEVAKIEERSLQLDVDNILRLEWHNDHEFGGGPDISTDDYFKIADSLILRLRYGGFSLGAEGTVHYYPDSLVLRRYLRSIDDFLETPASSDDFRLDHIYLEYRDKIFDVSLGDFYATFGRGLALSMRKQGQGEVDNSLQGGRLELRIADTRIHLLAGFSNTLNVDPNHETAQSDPHDLVGGLRLEQRLADTFLLSAHYVGSKFGALEGSGRQRFLPEDQTHIWGGTLEFPDIAGYLSLYFEGNYMRRSGREVNEDLSDFRTVEDQGYGIYSSVSLYIENFTLVGEYKLYQDFIFKRSRAKLAYILPEGEEPPDDLEFFEDIYYNDVPTLERSDIETNRDYGNDHGFRLRGDYRVESTDTEPYAALYFTVNKHSGSNTGSIGGFGSAGDILGDMIWHAYGGVTQHFGPIELYGDIGFRDEKSRDSGEELQEMIHAKLGVSAPLVPRHVLGVETFFLQKDYQLLKQLERNLDLTLSYSFARYFTLSFLYTLQQKDFLPADGEDQLDHFVAGEFRTNYLNWLEVSVFAGPVRESYRCYGGFCRRVPPFEGVKTRIRISF